MTWCASGALDRAAADLAVGWAVSAWACRALEDVTVRLHGYYLPQEINDDPELGHGAVVELYAAATTDLASDVSGSPVGAVAADECAALAACAGPGSAEEVNQVAELLADARGIALAAGLVVGQVEV